jgi:hypothetical protein
MIIAQQASRPIAAAHGALKLNLCIHEGTGGHCPFPDDALSRSRPLKIPLTSEEAERFHEQIPR